MCVPETFFPTDQLQSKKENDGPQATNEEKLSVTSSQPLLLGFLGVQTVCYPPEKSIIKMFRQENQEKFQFEDHFYHVELSIIELANFSDRPSLA